MKAPGRAAKKTDSLLAARRLKSAEEQRRALACNQSLLALARAPRPCVRISRFACAVAIGLRNCGAPLPVCVARLAPLLTLLLGVNTSDIYTSMCRIECVKWNAKVPKRKLFPQLAYHLPLVSKLGCVQAVRTLGYVGFGFSADGTMTDADMVIGWVYKDKVFLQVCSILKQCTDPWVRKERSQRRRRPVQEFHAASST
ncbi:Uncharacterized protein GBIM_00948 [Gryllus bimaculatus]|nr:Uncharacterized protein GBIM_00948 [Gryllus bimaculatus]